MMAIVRWTLWQRRWSTVWWSVGVFALIFINMIFYPTFKEDAAELQKSFEGLPDAALQLFGGSADFFSPVGFLNSQVFFLMLPLLLGILVIGLGSSLIAREEQDGTIELLLARPVSRAQLLAAKVCAGLVIITLVTGVGLLTTLIVGNMVNLEVSAGAIVSATFACWLLVLSWGALALLVTMTGRARGASVGIATLVALGGYLISSLSGTVHWLKGPSKLFPFHYYQPEPILRGTANHANLLFLIGVMVGCGLASWLVFRRRDL